MSTIIILSIREKENIFLPQHFLVPASSVSSFSVKTEPVVKKNLQKRWINFPDDVEMTESITIKKP